MSKEPAVLVEGLCHSYGKTAAIDGLSFHVNQGELFGLIGPDGAGKSTTMRALAGVIRPHEGKVRILGLDPCNHQSGVREYIGYMPERYSLYRDLSVLENLRFFGSLFGLDKESFRKRTERLLSITRLEGLIERRADELSGGMYKKLALACALLHEPDVLILDEATNGVDTTSRKDLWELLSEFVFEGMTIVISTSYMDEAERCDRVGFLYNGRLIMEGQPFRLARDFHNVVMFVGAAKAEVEVVLEDFAKAIIASAPWGGGLRVIVEREAAEAIELAIKRIGVGCESIQPNFEDIFLTAMNENIRHSHKGL